MMNYRCNRREFLNLGGASIAGVVSGPWLGAATAAHAQEVDVTSRDPDFVVFNAKVFTVDSRVPKAEAFAVKGGRFVAVGRSDEVKGLVGKKTQTFDARQMAIVPGFIDTHNHGRGEGLLYNVLVGNPYDVEFVTIQSIIDKLRARAATTPPGTWVEGYFFDDTKLKDNRSLNAQDLDRVSTEHPVFVHHRGGHTGFYNSVAFRRAGITKDTPNPYGGTYDKDENGELNGRVTDLAMATLLKAGTLESFSPAKKEKRVSNGVAFISKKLVEYGLTTVMGRAFWLPCRSSECAEVCCTG